MQEKFLEKHKIFDFFLKSCYHKEKTKGISAMTFSTSDAFLSALETHIAQNAHTVLAIDGPAASGKSTLAAALAKHFHAAVIHMDDFFLRPEQRTPARYAEPGGNFDRERFLSEVVPHLKNGQAFSYRRFDCASMALGETVTIPAAALVIVEGSYSHHPVLSHEYDMKLFLEISSTAQKKRILARNGEEGWKQFSTRWIPLEQSYFSAFSTREAADFVLDGEKGMCFQ